VVKEPEDPGGGVFPPRDYGRACLESPLLLGFRDAKGCGMAVAIGRVVPGVPFQGRGQFCVVRGGRATRL
jgi:hypothetical protein